MLSKEDQWIHSCLCRFDLQGKIITISNLIHCKYLLRMRFDPLRRRSPWHCTVSHKVGQHGASCCPLLPNRQIRLCIYYYCHTPWPPAPEGTPTFNFLFLIIDLSQSQILLPGRCFACLEISSLPAAQTSFLFLLARVR